MTLRTSCPGCGTAYTVPDDANGKKTRCQKCDQVFAVAVASPPDELDVTTFRMNVSQLGGEVELIKEWRIVKQ
jgi:predicted Zn finger-like uncharacterized protein